MLNGNVEENYTGHTLMKVFGHQGRARAEFENSNVALRDSAFMAQFMSGIMQPLMMFVGNLSLITVVAGGALRVDQPKREQIQRHVIGLSQKYHFMAAPHQCVAHCAHQELT